MEIIIGTGKYEAMPRGEKYTETKELADILVAKGAAVYEGQELPELEKAFEKALETETANTDPNEANQKVGTPTTVSGPSKKDKK